MTLADVLTTIPPDMPEVMRSILAVWLFVVGSCIGSFLNVVVLRLPAGISIVQGGSRCPVCLHDIRWYDNIPVFSWLVLRGRCRDCSTSISIRYPLVEALVGLIFLALGMSEALTGGTNLPLVGDGHSPAGLTVTGVWSIYAYHVTLITTLLAASLILRDGHMVPGRLFFFAMAVGLVGPTLMPILHPVPIFEASSMNQSALALLGAAGGFVSGWLFGQLVCLMFGKHANSANHGTAVALPSGMVGLFLGWQASLTITVASTIFFLTISAALRMFSVRRAGPWCAYLTFCTLAYIISWQTVDRMGRFGRPDTTWWFGASIAILLLLGLIVFGRMVVLPNTLAPIQDLERDDHGKQ